MSVAGTNHISHEIALRRIDATAAAPSTRQPNNRLTQFPPKNYPFSLFADLDRNLLPVAATTTNTPASVATRSTKRGFAFRLCLNVILFCQVHACWTVTRPPSDSKLYLAAACPFEVVTKSVRYSYSPAELELKCKKQCSCIINRNT